MNLIEQAAKDILAITSNSASGFGKTITLTTPDGATVLDITGLSTKHHIGYDTEGNSVNVKNAHVSFSESLLTAASYPVRNINGEVQLRGHKITTKDSTGIDKHYIITENFPDETVGFIVCILGDYANNPSEENTPSYIFQPKDAVVVNSDSTFTYNIPSGDTYILPDITHTDSDSQLVVLPAQTPMVCTPSTPKSGIAYALPQNSQTISYSQFDAGWHTANTPMPVNPTNPLYYAKLDYNAGNGLDTLVNDNVYGNKNRFTDELGTQVYANNYKRDHLHGLGWYEVVQTGFDWDGHLINANNLVHLGFSDFRLPNIEEVGSSYTFDSRYLVGVSTHDRFTSNTRLGFSTIAIKGNYLTYASGQNKTSTGTNTYYCRWHV